ncbi:hypothetical protein SH611_10765 [Geminicoccaceae bacterium 1502E]|nr:hypothetical protein [Geminicoccaceae bacterium 1502E]
MSRHEKARGSPHAARTKDRGKREPEAATDTELAMVRLLAMRRAGGKDEPEPVGRQQAMRELVAAGTLSRRKAAENPNPRPGMAARLVELEATAAAGTAHLMAGLLAMRRAGGKDEPEPAAPLGLNCAQRRRMEVRQWQAGPA